MSAQPVIGRPNDRVDGREKVSGSAKYTGDERIPGMLHAVVIPSTIASGRITRIDDRRARALTGVAEIMTHSNAPRVRAGKAAENDSILYLLQDTMIEFDRQPVAVAIADTLEQATYAASLVKVTYDSQNPITRLDRGAAFVPKQIFGEPAVMERGEPRRAFNAAPERLTQRYTTPAEHHNPMEPHATVAYWEGATLMLIDASQWAFGVQARMAYIFGIDKSQVYVRVPYVGGAFGGKGQPWSHVALAAMAAKLTGRPVRIVLTRPQMYGCVGHRPQTSQSVTASASRDGKLQSIVHAAINETSMSDEYVEPSAVFARDLYEVPNFGMSQELRRLNISKPTFQRGPGESTGAFAVESALDELAYALKLDPLELRLRNYAERQPNNGKPYSSKKLRECYAKAAASFGWNRRSAEPRSMRRGRLLVGYGMASASRATHRSGAGARIRMNSDGNVAVFSGTIEQGTGSPTVFAQLAAEILSLPPSRVSFVYGNTTLPYAPIAAGSQTAASIGSAVTVAALHLRDRLAARNGILPPEGIEVSADEKPDEHEPFAQQAFGAHFSEVEVDPDVGTVRVTRFTGAFDAGRILNEKTARSQLLGGVVWGISMALYEESRYDLRSARIMNANLSDYLVPTNADIPNAELIIIEDDDSEVNPAGVRGIGEVGICGSGAAVANAIYHATGIRVRDLPITPDKLLG